MARDYKPKHRKPSGFSGWLGLGLCLGLGLAAAGVVYLKDHRLDAPISSSGGIVCNPNATARKVEPQIR